MPGPRSGHLLDCGTISEGIGDRYAARGIPTAACYREVTATRLSGLFTQAQRWWDLADKMSKLQARCAGYCVVLIQRLTTYGIAVHLGGVQLHRDEAFHSVGPGLSNGRRVHRVTVVSRWRTGKRAGHPRHWGVRKLRWRATGRGKRGGYRIIYYLKRADGLIWMLTMSPKNVIEDIPPHVLRQIREEIENG